MRPNINLCSVVKVSYCSEHFDLHSTNMLTADHSRSSVAVPAAVAAPSAVEEVGDKAVEEDAGLVAMAAFLIQT